MALSYDKLVKQQADGLEALLAWAGTPSRCARLFGVSPSAVWAWQKDGRVSEGAARAASGVTGGAFCLEVLRPDVVERDVTNATD